MIPKHGHLAVEFVWFEIPCRLLCWFYTPDVNRCQHPPDWKIKAAGLGEWGGLGRAPGNLRMPLGQACLCIVIVMASLKPHSNEIFSKPGP